MPDYYLIDDSDSPPLQVSANGQAVILQDLLSLFDQACADQSSSSDDDDCFGESYPTCHVSFLDGFQDDADSADNAARNNDEMCWVDLSFPSMPLVSVFAKKRSTVFNLFRHLKSPRYVFHPVLQPSVTEGLSTALGTASHLRVIELNKMIYLDIILWKWLGTFSKPQSR